MADQILQVYDSNQKVYWPVRLKDNGDGTYAIGQTVSVAADIQLGSVELKDAAADTRASIAAANTARTTGTIVLAVQHVDASGNVLTLPAALAAGGGLKVEGVAGGVAQPVSDAPLATLTGAVDETAPTTDTASSGLNGRLQRIAQRMTSLWQTVAATGDALAEATLSHFASRLYAFNGTTWDRVGISGAGDRALRVALGNADTLSDGIGGTYIRPIANTAGTGDGTVSYPLQFNGSNYDRQRNSHEVTVLASAARTASVNSSDLTNYNARGVVVTIDVTATDLTPSIVATIKYKDTLSGKYVSLLASAAITAVGTTQLTVYPGATAAANAAVSMPLPRVWRVEVVAGDTDSITYSVSANYIN